MSSACWRRTACKPNDFDALFAGATAARFAALQSGAIDATVLLPPFNFYAETAGFANLGLTIDYTPELPFSGAVVNTNWAAKNRALLDRLLAVHNKSMAWFLDTKNRDEAITVMVEASKQKREDIAKAYDFLLQHKFFEASGKVSKTKMNALLAALQAARRRLGRAHRREAADAGRDAGDGLGFSERLSMASMSVLPRSAAGAWSSRLRSLAAPPGARRRHRAGRLGRRHLGQSVAALCGAEQRLFRRRRPQARPGVLAVERLGDPAARRRLLQHRAQRRHRRSDPRDREGRAGRRSSAS